MDTKARNVVQIDGSKGKWPAKFNGVEVAFPIFDVEGSLEDAVAFLVERSPDGESGVVAYLHKKVSTDQDSWLSGHLGQKATEDGKTYTRDEKAKLPERSEVLSAEDVAKLGNAWQIKVPRVGTATKLAAAESRKRRAEEERDAARAALLDMLRKLPKKEAAKMLDTLVANGQLPEGTEL